MIIIIIMVLFYLFIQYYAVLREISIPLFIKFLKIKPDKKASAKQKLAFFLKMGFKSI